MTRKQRHYKKRTQRVRKMRGGVILKKSANDKNYLTYTIIEKGYGGDNGNGMITVRISPAAMKNNGSTVKVIAKDLKPMKFDIGESTYTMNFKVDFGN